MIRVLLSIALALLPTMPASGQNRIATFQDAAHNQPVRVNVGMNFFLPGPTDDSQEAAAVRDRAKRMIYQLAIRECSIAKEVLASDCRIESVNVSINVNRSPPNVADGHNVNGNIVLRVTLK